jgi:hypothetical protein
VDALAWAVCELLDDIAAADGTVARAAGQASVLWRTYWSGDECVERTTGRYPRPDLALKDVPRPPVWSGLKILSSALCGT